MNIKFFEDQGYTNVRQLPDGSFAGLVPLIYTVGLCIGLDEINWKKRFCFEDYKRALLELEKLESIDDEPVDGWVARRGK